MDVIISGDSIKLGQFLKLANLVETGGHAKEVIAAGEVEVNGEPITARGHMLYDDDLVTIPTASISATVVAGDSAGGADGEDYFDERTANDDFDPEKWRNL